MMSVYDEVLDALDERAVEPEISSLRAPEEAFFGGAADALLLAAATDRSETAVRQALARLESDGLVRRLGRLYSDTRAQYFTASAAVHL